MAKADGSVIINTRIDSKSFASGAKQLSSKGVEACQKLSAGFSKLGGIIGAALSVGKLIQFGAAASKAAREYSDALIGLQSIVEGQGRSFSNAQAFIEEYTKDGLIPATNAITAYKNLALRGYDDSQIKQVMIALKDASAYGRAASYSMGDAVQSATEGLKNENSILVDNAGVTKNVAKMWDEYAASIGTTSNNLTQQQKIQAEVAGIMAETKFQTGDAAKVSGTLSGQLQQLSFNFNSLKVAVGGIINPIVQYVLPAINAAVAGFTKLANAAAQVVSILFGKVSTTGGGIAEQNSAIASTAIAGAEAEEKLADATKAAGKAAKKSLAGFDELNTLQEKTSGGGGSSSGTGSTAGGVSGGGASPITSETVVEDTMSIQIKKLADRIKNGQWSEVASELTGQLNNAIKSVDWQGIGEKIGSYFNNALVFLATAIGDFDFASLGEAIADSLMGLWNSIDWGVAGKGFSDGIIGVITTISSAIKKIDWKKIGKDVAKFIKNIDWSGVTSALFDGIGAAIGGLAAFIWGLVEDAWASVIDWWYEVAYEDGEFTMEGLLEGIWNAIKNIGKWIKENIFDPFIEGFKEAFGIQGSSQGSSKEMEEQGEYVIDGLWEGIKSAWKNIPKFFSEKLEGIKTTIQNSWNTIKTKTSETWSSIKNSLSEKWNQIKNKASEKFSAAKDKVLNAWNTIKNSQTWSTIKTNLTTKWNEIRDKASEKFTETKNKVLGAWTAIKDSKTWSDIKSSLSSSWDDIKNKAEDKFGKIRDTISGTWSSIKDALSGENGSIDFGTIGTAVKDAFTSGINKLIAGLNDAIYRIIYKINDLILDARAIHFEILGKTHYPFFNMPMVPQVAIPYLAKGAVIPPNAPFMAMLGDQRHGTNIEAPLSTIQEAVALVLEDMTGGLMAGFEATVAVLREILEAILGIEIGDTVIAEAVERYNRKMAVVKGG